MHGARLGGCGSLYDDRPGRLGGCLGLPGGAAGGGWDGRGGRGGRGGLVGGREVGAGVR